MKLRILIAIYWVILGLASVDAQEALRLLPLQGRITDQGGATESNGIRVVQFKIFQEPTSGSPVWSGEIHRTTVNGGLVNVILGTKNTLNGVDFDRPLFLEVTVDIDGDNAITTSDPPMAPRQTILPVIFANESGNAKKLAGYDWSPLFGVNSPVDGRIDGTKLAEASISGSKVADGQIQDRHIGVVSRLSALDGEPSFVLAVDHAGNVGIRTNAPQSELHVVGRITGSSLDIVNGIIARGPTDGEFAFTGGYSEGVFQNWLGSGSDAECVRLIGANGERAGGFGQAAGPSIASPIVWFYAFEDRNCFQVRSVDYDFAARRSRPVPEGTALLTVRRIGGGARVGIGIENPESALDIAGQGRARNGFVNSSDRDVKSDFAPIDSRQILKRLEGVPIRTWRYTNDDSIIRHIGPVSQDFNAAFGVGFDDKHISTVDSAGVALAAIQGLSQIVSDGSKEIIEELRQSQVRKDQEIEDLRRRIQQLERSLKSVIETMQAATVYDTKTQSWPRG